MKSLCYYDKFVLPDLEALENLLKKWIVVGLAKLKSSATRMAFSIFSTSSLVYALSCKEGEFEINKQFVHTCNPNEVFNHWRVNFFNFACNEHCCDAYKLQFLSIQNLVDSKL